MSVHTEDSLAHGDEIPIMHRTCALSRWRAWLLLVIACVAVVGNFAPWLRFLPDPNATSLHSQSSARGDKDNSMFPAGPQFWENESDIPLHGGLNNSVSACLLVMDDNHRLVEWIAYHYFVMPLRHLILLPDSKSRTSPMEIVQRWKPYMSIDVWNDGDFMTDALREFAKSKENSTDPGDGFLVHTHRQETFYKQCAVHLQAKQRTWTIFSDVDEYWVINEDVVPDFDVRMQTSGAILNLLDEIRQVDHPNADIYKGQSIISVSPIGFYSCLPAHAVRFLVYVKRQETVSQHTVPCSGQWKVQHRRFLTMFRQTLSIPNSLIRCAIGTIKNMRITSTEKPWLMCPRLSAWHRVDSMGA
jgi:hypothetical protein